MLSKIRWPYSSNSFTRTPFNSCQPSEAHYNLGNALRGGNLTAAVASYSQFNQIRISQMPTNLGRTLHLKGELLTLFPYQKALELDPRHSNATYSIGLSKHAKGTSKKASSCSTRRWCSIKTTRCTFRTKQNLQSIAESQTTPKIDEINKTNSRKKINRCLNLQQQTSIINPKNSPKPLTD